MRPPNGTLTKPLSPPMPVRAHDSPREATTTPPADATAPPPPTVVVIPPQLTKDGASDSAAKSLIICKGSCHLTNLHVTNLTVSDRYLMVFNSPQVPPDGTRPRRSYWLTADSTYEWDAPHGRYYGDGCVAVLSSTKDRLTIVTADDGRFDAAFFRP